jgi:hypothetical protein
MARHNIMKRMVSTGINEEIQVTPGGSMQKQILRAYLTNIKKDGRATAVARKFTASIKN